MNLALSAMPAPYAAMLSTPGTGESAFQNAEPSATRLPATKMMTLLIRNSSINRGEIRWNSKGQDHQPRRVRTAPATRAENRSNHLPRYLIRAAASQILPMTRHCNREAIEKAPRQFFARRMNRTAKRSQHQHHPRNVPTA